MQLASHIQYIIDRYSNELLASLKQEGRTIALDQVIDVLLACDPSESKRLVDWLVKTYIGGGFRWEDIETGSESKLAEVLGLYQTYSSRIPRDQRNLYLYKSYGELYTLVKPYIPQEKTDDPGSREIKRRERARALEESEVLYRSEQWIVAVPLTENAAKWWGRGTKWCTAADKNNYFDHYNQDAPLIVITLLNSGSARGVEKFQFWSDRYDVQFMDAQDCEVSRETIKEYWHLFKPFIEHMIENGRLPLSYIPEELQTIDFCTRVVEKNGGEIANVSSRLVSLDLYRLAVKQNGKVIRSMPIHLITPEICRLAVEQDGEAIAYVPKDIIDDELCRIAVKRNGKGLYSIRKSMLTDEICRSAVKNYSLAIQYIPDHFKTTEFCKFAVELDGKTLYWIPESMKTDELCKLAVRQNGKALYSVPKHLKTLELCVKAVENNGSAIECVPFEYQTVELCRLAIKQDPMAISFIPQIFKTTDMYRFAVQSNALAILNIANEYQTDELVTIAIEGAPETFKVISYEKKTYELCKRFIKKSPELIDYVPQEYQTPELLAIAGDIKKLVRWNHSILSPLRDQLNRYFERENCYEISQSYPIHH